MTTMSKTEIRNTLKGIFSFLSDEQLDNFTALFTPLHEEAKEEPDQDLEQIVTNVLHEIGVPAHLKGHTYLRAAVIMCLNDDKLIHEVTKLLYPIVSKNFATTSSRVERAIRHAIEVAWDRGDVEVLNGYFGYTIQGSRGKPTNSEFIAMLSDTIRLKYKL